MTLPPPPAQLIEQVTTALDELRSQLAAIDHSRYQQPCSLPGWSTAQMIAHLASFADAARRQLEHAGDNVPAMFDGGAAGRAEAINLAALMRPEALAAKADTALAQLRAVLPLGLERWELASAYRPGAQIADMMFATWREMLVHATDLDASVRPAASWPVEFSAHLLRALEARVPAGSRITLQPHGAQPIVLGTAQPASSNSWVLSGTDYDLAAWLAGRPATGPVQATSGADAASYPQLDPWPADRLMRR